MKTESWMIIAGLLQEARKTEQKLAKRIDELSDELMSDNERQREFQRISYAIYDIANFALVLLNYGVKDNETN